MSSTTSSTARESLQATYTPIPPVCLLCSLASCSPLIPRVHRQTRRKMVKGLTPHPPPRLTPPPLPLLTAVSRLVRPVSFVPLAVRIGILRWKLKPPHGKGIRLLNESPTAPMMRSPRNQGSGERLSASHVTSVESARLLVGNHPQAAWIALASEFLFCPRLHSILSSFSEI